jgi:hypothetical protein
LKSRFVSCKKEAGMQTERYIGIDYLKGFFSVCVVLIHIGYISQSLIFDTSRYLEHILTVSDLVNFYLLLLAVPVFFLISSFLFFQKPQDTSVLLSSLKRIGKIAVFWIVLHTILEYRGREIIDWLPKSFEELVVFIVSGGHTIYYFFVSLIGLTIITHFSKRLPVIHVLALFIISTLLVAMLPIVSMATNHFILSVHWNPLNFIPYPFAAILVFHIAKLDSAKIKPIYIILIAVLIVLLIIADWTIYVNRGFFQVNLFAIPAYSRPSLVLIAMVVVLLGIKIQPKQNAVILFMSNNSLALYCLHLFFKTPANRLSGGNLFMYLFLVVVFSYVAGIILKQFIRQELIN